MNDLQTTVTAAVNNIAIQVENLCQADIGPDLPLLGDDSPFDSFSMLLLLVELEQNIGSNLPAGSSLVEWFSTLDFDDSSRMTLQQFSELLLNKYFKG